jgi:hypothetical protein
MTRIIVFVLFALLAAPSIARENGFTSNCVIDAVDWGLVEPALDTAGDLISEGVKPLYKIIGIHDDTDYGPSFILFKIPSLASPALFGTLRLQVFGVQPISDDVPYLPIILYDVNDLNTVYQPLWDIDQWRAVKDDFMSGRVYGNFKVLPSPAEDGVILDIPLSYDAIYDINAAAGGKFAIAIAPGKEYWAAEAEYVTFRSPDSGGIAQIEITTVTGKKSSCGKSKRKEKHEYNTDRK